MSENFGEFHVQTTLGGPWKNPNLIHHDSQTTKQGKSQQSSESKPPSLISDSYEEHITRGMYTEVLYIIFKHYFPRFNCINLSLKR